MSKGNREEESKHEEVRGERHDGDGVDVTKTREQRREGEEREKGEEIFVNGDRRIHV